jgi:hypothetical protein
MSCGSRHCSQQVANLKPRNNPSRRRSGNTFRHPADPQHVRFRGGTGLRYLLNTHPFRVDENTTRSLPIKVTNVADIYFAHARLRTEAAADPECASRVGRTHPMIALPAPGSGLRLVLQIDVGVSMARIHPRCLSKFWGVPQCADPADGGNRNVIVM